MTGINEVSSGVTFRSPTKRLERVPRELQSTRLSCGDDDEGTNIILIFDAMDTLVRLHAPKNIGGLKVYEVGK